MMQTKKWTYLVLGLGKTGMSCAHHLLKKNQDFALADSRQNVEAVNDFIKQNLNIDIFYGAWSLDILLSAECLVVSPGISLSEPVIAEAISQGVRVSSDIELFMESVTQPVVAVTGSNGKSTVVSLLGEMAKCAGLSVPVAGNIGLPVLDLLDEKGNEVLQDQRHIYDAYVLELSSFQLERMPPINFKCASILNVSEDHLDRYDRYEDYITAKHIIYSAAEVCVFNRQDENTFIRENDNSKAQISFGIDQANDQHYGLEINRENQKHSVISLMRGNECLIDSAEVLLQGQHNLSNALAALAMVEAMGWNQSAALKALKIFPGLTHRCEFVDKINGVVYINDSKGTNVGATLAAIQGLCALSNQRAVLIVGGEGKGADFLALKDAMNQYGRAVVCIGSASNQLKALFEKEIQCVLAHSMQEAVDVAANLAQGGDYVLLSPACASFDMFKNFEHRGNVFTDCVAKIKQSKSTQGVDHV